jgi:hypothetical protein
VSQSCALLLVFDSLLLPPPLLSLRLDSLWL